MSGLRLCPQDQPQRVDVSEVLKLPDTIIATVHLKKSQAESQRDSVSKPRVATQELPWENAPRINNPNGVAAQRNKFDTTPLGLKTIPTETQGSSCLPPSLRSGAARATLGWRTQSRWDCRRLRLVCDTAALR